MDMCGILGGVWLRGFVAIASRFEDVVEALWFRGLDDSGVEHIECAVLWVALGHTRLSVIDLISVGHQPMLSADGYCSIVFNGEIYNYLELRWELAGLGHAFFSNFDIEVLLAVWR